MTATDVTEAMVEALRDVRQHFTLPSHLRAPEQYILDKVSAALTAFEAARVPDGAGAQLVSDLARLIESSDAFECPANKTYPQAAKDLAAEIAFWLMGKQCIASAPSAGPVNSTGWATKEEIDAAKEKIRTSAGRIPEGYVLVPKEPTTAMCQAWESAYEGAPPGSGQALAWDDAYTAMLAAAPPAPTVKLQPLTPDQEEYLQRVLAASQDFDRDKIVGGPQGRPEGGES